MNASRALFRGFFLSMALGLWMAVAAAFAQSDPAAGAPDSAPRHTPQRPVYLDIRPVADARYSLLPEELVASVANEALSNAHQATIRMSGPDLPAGVRVLRIMYIVHRQDAADGVIAAVAASTELLRTSHEGDGGVQTLSIYNGLQQTLVQGPNVTRAREPLRDAFNTALQARIRSAFQNAAAL